MFVELLCLPHSAKQQGVKDEEDKAPDRGKSLPGTHSVRDAQGDLWSLSWKSFLKLGKKV